MFPIEKGDPEVSNALKNLLRNKATCINTCDGCDLFMCPNLYFAMEQSKSSQQSSCLFLSFSKSPKTHSTQSVDCSVISHEYQKALMLVLIIVGR